MWVHRDSMGHYIVDFDWSSRGLCFHQYSELFEVMQWMVVKRHAIHYLSRCCWFSWNLVIRQINFHRECLRAASWILLLCSFVCYCRIVHHVFVFPSIHHHPIFCSWRIYYFARQWIVSAPGWMASMRKIKPSFSSRRSRNTRVAHPLPTSNVPSNFLIKRIHLLPKLSIRHEVAGN